VAWFHFVLFYYFVWLIRSWRGLSRRRHISNTTSTSHVTPSDIKPNILTELTRRKCREAKPRRATPDQTTSRQARPHKETRRKHSVTSRRVTPNHDRRCDARRHEIRCRVIVTLTEFASRFCAARLSASRRQVSVR
jgi:hypothetical protein